VNIKFLQRKSFAPAKDYLAYAPNNSDEEVAAIEGRTVSCIFAYKSPCTDTVPQFFKEPTNQFSATVAIFCTD
jgi:hypothetical protein